jgi:hypothetical protein
VGRRREACNLVPLSVESFGRLSKPAMGLLNALADAAHPMRELCKSAFVTSAHWWLSVALCRDNGQMYGQSLFTLAHASERAFQPDLLVPVAE